MPQIDLYDLSPCGWQMLSAIHAFVNHGDNEGDDRDHAGRAPEPDPDWTCRRPRPRPRKGPRDNRLVLENNEKLARAYRQLRDQLGIAGSHDTQSKLLKRACRSLRIRVDPTWRVKALTHAMRAALDLDPTAPRHRVVKAAVRALRALGARKAR